MFVDEIKGYYVTAVNDAVDSWSENFFMNFFSGETLTDEEMIYGFDIYTKASYANPKATLLKHFDVDMMYVMSDGSNEAMPVLINSKGSNVYVTVSRYEKTFFLNPFDYPSAPCQRARPAGAALFFSRCACRYSRGNI